MAIGRNVEPGPGRDKLERCWEDRWIQGSYHAVQTGGSWSAPWIQVWTVTVEAEACCECFCSDCVTSKCAESERDKEYNDGDLDDADAGDLDTDGTNDMRGRFLVRPMPPIKHNLCMANMVDLESNCKDKKCISWSPEGGSVEVEVAFDGNTAPSEEEMEDSIQTELFIGAFMQSSPDILGGWVGCNCDAFVGADG